MKKSKVKSPDTGDDESSEEDDRVNPNEKARNQNTADRNSLEEMLVDIENEDLSNVMNPYTHEEAQLKKSKARIKESMKDVLGFNNKADFNHKTFDVIKHLVCLRFLHDRTKLRMNAKRRHDLFFIKGLEALDKEMDIAYILRQVRILRYFLKTALDRD